MNTTDIVRAWGKILVGRTPSLSIEVTKECPLRCPGCYAFSEGHLGVSAAGESLNLRQLHDLKGPELIAGVLALVKELRPLHVSLVGGDPLVRYRELEVIVPALLERGVHVQVVTSAFRPPPAAWADYEHFTLTVSVDGLPAEHDVRRSPATYERILKNIAGHHVVVHCTVTSGMDRPGYLEEFVRFWSENADTRKIWMSIFTPQRGEELAETPSPAQRARLIAELTRLRAIYPRLDLRLGMLEAMTTPPASPSECVFARTTTTISADLRTRVGPCQFGGDPDCSKCGCVASMGLAAVANHRLPGGVRVGAIFDASLAIGGVVARARRRAS